MNVVNDFPGSCPEDCGTEVTFPPASANADCLNYPLYESQIGDVIIVPTGAPDPFGESWTGDDATLTYVADTIDNADATNLKARRFRGIGSLGEADTTYRDGPYGLRIKQSSAAPFEFIIDNVDAANWAFAKVLDCNPTNFTVYFATAYHTFGVAGGMALSELEVQTPLGAGPDDVEQIIVRASLQWKAARYQRAANNPFN